MKTDAEIEAEELARAEQDLKRGGAFVPRLGGSAPALRSAASHSCLAYGWGSSRSCCICARRWRRAKGSSRRRWSADLRSGASVGAGPEAGAPGTSQRRVFPFAVFYTKTADKVTIYAVVDCRREPAWIRRRLEK
jgi:hypothetical protein